MSWKDDVEDAIHRHFRVGQIFTTVQLWQEAKQELSDLHPTVKDVNNTVLNCLQKLRNDGLLEFLDRGRYRLTR